MNEQEYMIDVYNRFFCQIEGKNITHASLLS